MRLALALLSSSSQVVLEEVAVLPLTYLVGVSPQSGCSVRLKSDQKGLVSVRQVAATVVCTTRSVLEMRSKRLINLVTPLFCCFVKSFPAFGSKLCHVPVCVLVTMA